MTQGYIIQFYHPIEADLPEDIRKDWSIYGGWVNPFEPINKGRLGSTQEWRIEKPKRHYY